QPDEGLKALLDVRQDLQLVDDGVGRVSGDDRRLGPPDIASFTVTLLGMADGGPLHRALHGAGTTARADVQTAQSQLVAYAFAVQVFLTADGVTAPAHDEAWRDTRAQQGGIAQHIEDQRAVHIHRALDVDGVGAFRVIVVTGTVGLPRH